MEAGPAFNCYVTLKQIFSFEGCNATNFVRGGAEGHLTVSGAGL